MVVIYGIKNCNTVQKALKWLSEHNIAAKLHDYRVDGIDKDWLKSITHFFGYENVVNKKSTTWRNLDQVVKENLSADHVLEIMLQHPTLIKRPIVWQDNYKLIGFAEKEYQRVFLNTN